MNHLHYPFVEPWFKQMVAYSINYNQVNQAATNGQWKKANTYILTPEAPGMVDFYNATIRDQYEIGYNYSKAAEILAANAYYDAGVWYTNDVPAAYTTMKGPGGATLVDAQPGHAGMNIALDNFEINVPAGWGELKLQLVNGLQVYLL
jgi:ABC-type transport system substrate-binding protein